MISEEESKQNPIEILEEQRERRFVIGFDEDGKVNSPLVVAHEFRLNRPLKLNFGTLASKGLGEVPGRKGGFCIRAGDQIIMLHDEPISITPATHEEFQEALTKGPIVVIEPPST